MYIYIYQELWYINVWSSIYLNIELHTCIYGVALVSRIDEITSLFCKRALQKRQYSAKETYNLIDPTDHSHPISVFLYIRIPAELSIKKYRYLCVSVFLWSSLKSRKTNPEIHIYRYSCISVFRWSSLQRNWDIYTYPYSFGALYKTIKMFLYCRIPLELSKESKGKCRY